MSTTQTTKADVLLTAMQVQGPWPANCGGFVMDLFEVDSPLRLFEATDRLRPHADKSQIEALAQLRWTIGKLLFESDGPMFVSERSDDWPEEIAISMSLYPWNYTSYGKA